jgi:hypothetical protein
VWVVAVLCGTSTEQVVPEPQNCSALLAVVSKMSMNQGGSGGAGHGCGKPEQAAGCEQD